MAILGASASITRFRIVEEVPSDLWPQIPDLLIKHAFKDIDHNADERSWGWVCFDNMLDPDWRTAPPEKAAYFAFSLRLDTRRIPPAVFKKHFALAVAEEERANKEQGRNFVSRDRKKELREQVRLKLLARMLPIPATFDIAWNIEKNLIYFDSTSAKVLEMFSELFTETFDLHLEPLTPFWMGLQLLGEEATERLEQVEEADFTS